MKPSQKCEKPSNFAIRGHYYRFVQEYLIAFAPFSKTELQKESKKKRTQNSKKLKKKFFFQKKNVIVKFLKNRFKRFCALFGKENLFGNFC